jgi:glutamyl-Q tRNA(Asp) synthetase
LGLRVTSRRGALANLGPCEGRYRGRFAPSPTGPLHAGSLVAALASWLDARVHGGVWLVRIEDVDAPRCPPGVDRVILGQLAACGLSPDEPPWWQSQRTAVYRTESERLQAAGHAYGCCCTRSEIQAVLAARGGLPSPGSESVYPGTCREGLHGRPARATRFRVESGPLRWQDRRLGLQVQDVAVAVGDFVIHRADGLAAYQLAVVIDDAAQGITHVVRGVDLADNTPRQIQLQQAIGLPTPLYLHTPLVLAPDGRKLSKSNGADPLDLVDPVVTLRKAGEVLGLPSLPAATPAEWLAQAEPAWAGIIEGFVERNIP